MKAFVGVLGLFVYLPLWTYLMYKILVHIEATELMWFLFYVYVPAGLLFATASELAKK